jgi:hypothetical protein
MLRSYNFQKSKLESTQNNKDQFYFYNVELLVFVKN